MKKYVSINTIKKTLRKMIQYKTRNLFRHVCMIMLIERDKDCKSDDLPLRRKMSTLFKSIDENHDGLLDK